MADQKRTDPDWQDMRVFLALGRHGSLSAAARTLSVNHATIARRIRSLEAALGEKLIERRPEGYVLTPAGVRALAAASDMERAVGGLGRSDGGDAPAGLVRVNASPALAQGYLIRRLAELPVLHPALDVELVTDLRAVSLERREADIAVRLSRPQDGDLMARKLVTIGYGFYGSAEARRLLEDGRDPVFVGFDEVNAQLPEALWLARQFPRARIAFRTNHQAAQAIAAQAGAGLALLPHYIGRATADLIPCDLGAVPPAREAWLVTRREGRSDLPIRMAAEHMAKVFTEDRALFEP